MRYLLDANVIITADRDYYPLHRVPEFWEWIVHHASHAIVKIPHHMYEEITVKEGKIVDWLKQNSKLLVVEHEVYSKTLRKVLSIGYGDDISAEEERKIGKDPFILAYALMMGVESTTIVTTEVSKPTKQRASRKLPDASLALGVRCINTFELVQELDFRTSWRRASDTNSAATKCPRV